MVFYYFHIQKFSRLIKHKEYLIKFVKNYKSGGDVDDIISENEESKDQCQK